MAHYGTAVACSCTDTDDPVIRTEPQIVELLRRISDTFSGFHGLYKDAEGSPTRFPREVVRILQDLCTVQELLLEEYRRSGPSGRRDLPPPADPESFRRDAVDMVQRIVDDLRRLGSVRTIDVPAGSPARAIAQR